MKLGADMPQVRTPLNAVINYLEIALEKPLEDSTKEALTSSYAASKSLIYVIDDLLNLTGTSTESIPMLSDPFDITCCLEEALDPLKRLAREKGIAIISRVTSPTSRFLRGDPPSLQRAASILVANAIEHTTNGLVTVEWSEVSRLPTMSTMRVAVTDSGPGLTERDLDDMFQEFEQVPDEDFDENRGKIISAREDVLRVGVGLAFVARYVKQRNGQLKVISVKNRGSTFAIEIPFMLASRAASLAARRDAFPLPALPMPGPPTGLSAGPPTAVAPAALATPSGSSGVELSPPIVAPTPRMSPLGTAGQTPASFYFTILIADDNPINIQILSKRLTKMGHHVLVSRDGQDCFNVFLMNQATIDFILMDLNVSLVINSYPCVTRS